MIDNGKQYNRLKFDQKIRDMGLNIHGGKYYNYIITLNRNYVATVWLPPDLKNYDQQLCHIILIIQNLIDP